MVFVSYTELVARYPEHRGFLPWPRWRATASYESHAVKKCAIYRCLSCVKTGRRVEHLLPMSANLMQRKEPHRGHLGLRSANFDQRHTLIHGAMWGEPVAGGLEHPRHVC